jgi:hypothetical protein
MVNEPPGRRPKRIADHCHTQRFQRLDFAANERMAYGGILVDKAGDVNGLFGWRASFPFEIASKRRPMLTRNRHWEFGSYVV